jgi:hypothetical protein
MLHDIEKKIIILKNSSPKSIPMAISPNIDLARATVLRECIFKKIEELAESIHEMCSKNRLVSAMSLQRALMETQALFWVFLKKIEEAIKTNKLDDFKNFLTKALSGARSDVATKKFGRPQSNNALTYIDQVNKIIPGYRECYDLLSEFVHPNSAGVRNVYNKLDWNNREIHFGDNREKINIDFVIKNLDISLDWFISEYNRSADLLNQYSVLSFTNFDNNEKQLR